MVWSWGGACLARLRLCGASRSTLLGPLFGVLLLLLAPLAAEAATITVTNTGTAVSGADGTCTLIEAITAANNNTASGGAVGECAAGQPDGTATDLIVLQAGQTYTLSAVHNVTEGPNGLPAVTSAITIQGNGAIVERSAAGGTPELRMLFVGTGANLRLENLTLRNGAVRSVDPSFLDCAGGGAIRAHSGQLTLVGVTVYGNVVRNQAGQLAPVCLGGGGIVGEDSTVVITDSVIRDNTSEVSGGGIFTVDGSLTITGSTIASNRAETTLPYDSRGGGIVVFGTGTYTIMRSTISGNVGQDVGGIRIIGATGTIANSTISGNRATSVVDLNTGRGGFTVGGIKNGEEGDGNLTLINVTVTANVADDPSTDFPSVGGLRNAGTAILRNTIVAGNVVAGNATATFADCGVGVPVVTSQGNNVVGNGTGCPSNSLGDVTVAPSAVFTSLLGPLANNGGPTQTHVLMSGSPGTGNGAVAVCAAAPVSGVDQRGTIRLRCDSGAYEDGTPGPPSGGPIVVNAQCTLIEAIEAANRDAPFGGCPAGQGADTIVLAASSTHTLTTAYETAANPGPNGLPSITSDITIEGNGATIQRVAADSVRFRIFHVNGTGALTLRNVTVTGGRTADLVGAGGGIFVRGASARLTLDGASVRENVATGEGGGISNGSVFTSGGQGGTVTLTNSVVSSNSAGAGGGGISTQGGVFTVTTSTISNNLCTGTGTTFGGGVLVSQTAFSMTGGAIATNTAKSAGGMSNGGHVTLTNVQVSGNQATASTGGGIDNRGELRIVGGSVSTNTAAGGGGIANLIENLVGGAAALTIEGTDIAGNRATSGGGGGILAYGAATLTSAQVTGNRSATSGGGLQLVNAGAVVALDNTTVALNIVDSGSGGGIANGLHASPYLSGGTLTVRNSTIRENRVTEAAGSLGAGGGGGIAAVGGRTEVVGSTIQGNAVQTANNGIYTLGAGIMGSGFTNAATEIIVSNSTIADNVISGGISAGGGIDIQAGSTLTVTGSTLTGNRANEGGGLFGGASAVGTVTDTTIRANTASRGAGATILLGSLTLDRTTVAENTATTSILAGQGYGGGLVNHGGTLVVRNSSVTNNRADGPYGGGIASVLAGGGTNVTTVRQSLVSGNQATTGSGGAIYNEGTTLAILDSTVSGNTAATNGGGVVQSGAGSLSIGGSTVADNRAGGAGAGLATNGTPIRLRNSIVGANQQAGSLTAANADCLGAVTSDGYNLTGSGTGCPTSGTGDLTVSPTSLISGVIAALAENGGPTKTHALTSGSRAIDAGNPSAVGPANPNGCSDTDQRGTARPLDGDSDGTKRCDIGAYEAPFGTSKARCAPRPNVGLAITPAGAGRIQVVVSAQTDTLTPSNSLTRLQFTAPANAAIDVVGGPSNASGATTYTPPAGTTQVTFFVRRVAAGAIQVPLVVTDECGEWTTFVGGGAAAF